MFHKLSKRKDLFSLLVKSLCPSIFGNELVKAGMILSLFGGTDYRLKRNVDFTDIIFGVTKGERKSDITKDEEK